MALATPPPPSPPLHRAVCDIFLSTPPRLPILIDNARRDVESAAAEAWSSCGLRLSTSMCCHVITTNQP
jgi:hypothetical protein